MDQHPHPLEGKYEPESRDVQTPLEAAAMSIAISLKRIADHLDKRAGSKGPTYHCIRVDDLARGESYGNYILDSLTGLG